MAERAAIDAAGRRDLDTMARTARPPRHDELASALRAQADGLYCTEAAVELLAGHRAWLARSDFVTRFVEVLDEDEQDEDEQEMAVLDWSGALDALEHGKLACSSSEGQVLRLAGSLACGVPVDLQHALCGLDATNAGLVAAAVLHAAGYPSARNAPTPTPSPSTPSPSVASPSRVADVHDRLEVTLRVAVPDLDLAERR
jgi:hypothetical protein